MLMMFQPPGRCTAAAILGLVSHSLTCERCAIVIPSHFTCIPRPPATFLMCVCVCVCVYCSESAFTMQSRSSKANKCSTNCVAQRLTYDVCACAFRTMETRNSNRAMPNMLTMHFDSIRIYCARFCEFGKRVVGCLRLFLYQS